MRLFLSLFLSAAYTFSAFADPTSDVERIKEAANSLYFQSKSPNGKSVAAIVNSQAEISS